MKPIEFWFSIGSTYSFLTVMRLKSVAEASGAAFEWRPFSVRAIFREINNGPVAPNPAKSAYMWRDIERRAAAIGLAARLPAPYPLEAFDLANRVAVLGCAEGWGPDYVVATYRRWFGDGQPAGEEPNLSDSLREIGQDPARVLAEAESEAGQRNYLAATDAARERGIFGAPTFVVDGELFWGDDRLEHAIAWARDGRL